jgi:hypothetical protein
MGLFDRFRAKKSEPAPTAPAPPIAPVWQPKPPLVAALEVASITTGVADDPEVMAVHEALEVALAKVFGNQAPLGWTRMPPGPLAYVRVYWVDTPRGPYFHYLGWGLSEIGPKISSVVERSGFGIELSMKVRAFADEAVAPGDTLLALNAPTWPAALLTNLSATVLRTRHPYGHDHWIEARDTTFGPEKLRYLGCAHDSSIAPIDTPNGQFRFVQIYAIDDAELDEMKRAEAEQRDAPVLARRQAADPDLVIDRVR